MEMDTGQESNAERDFLHTILDSTISIAEKLSRLSEALDVARIDACCTLDRDQDPTLAGIFPLLLAVSVGDTELVEFLVRRGADVNQTMDDPYFQQVVCPTALHQACLDGRLDLVQVLVEPPLSLSSAAIHLEPVNARGQTPYHLAVESGNTDLVEYLVEGGCWIEACDANGNNALHMSTFLGQDAPILNMVDTLVGLGVSIYHRNRLGFTPVKLAMLLGKETVTRMMLSRTFHGSRLQEVGFHPLEAAVVNRKLCSIASVLDRLSATASGLPSTDESLNIVVLNSGLNGILEQLLSSSQMRSLIDVNGSLGYTPLYNACASGNTDAVRMLLDAGADPDRPSQRQHVLPLKKTVLQNDLETTKLLLDFGASACHCPSCSPLLRRPRGVHSPAGSQAALAGSREDELDLLYLALFTDVTLCHLLVSGGTCISTKAVQMITENAEHRCLCLDLYRAGFHGVLKQILSNRTSSTNQNIRMDDNDDYDIETLLLSPPTLALICRTVFRKTVRPKIRWAVRKLSLPQTIKRYLLLEA